MLVTLALALAPAQCPNGVCPLPGLARSVTHSVARTVQRVSPVRPAFVAVAPPVTVLPVAPPAVVVKPTTLPLPMPGPANVSVVKTSERVSVSVAHRPHLFARLRAGVAGALFRGMP